MMASELAYETAAMSGAFRLDRLFRSIRLSGSRRLDRLGETQAAIKVA